MSNFSALRFVRNLPVVLLTILTLLSVSSAHALEKATVQLKWLHHFQFAGYYAALEKGFYREAGLDVTILEGGPDEEVERDVANGKIDFGVGTSALLLNRAKGQDLVVLAQIFQHSPATFLALRKTGIRSIADMNGRRFMYSNEHGDMLALLKKNGISEENITRVPHTGDPNDLIRGKADVMIAYSFNEPFILEQAGEPYLMFSPMSYGMDFYGDNLFTTRKLANERPEYVEAFRSATLRGWRYAMSNRAEIADLILAKYSKEKSRDWLLFEANQLEPLIHPSLVELGYQNPSRWQNIAETFSNLGMLPAGYDATAIIYRPKTPHDYRLAAGVVLVSSLIIAALAVIVWMFSRLNRKLSAANEELVSKENKLRVVFDASLAGLMMIDPAGHIVTANEQMAEMFGFALSELIGTYYPDHVHPEQNTSSDENMNRLINGEINKVYTERHYICKDGSDFWGLLSSRRLEAPVGSRHSLVVVITDITERKHEEEERENMQQQLLHAQKLESLGIMAGGIAHDFNNLLQSILGNIEMAEMKLDPDSSPYKYLSNAKISGKRAAQLTSLMLTYVGREITTKKELDLNVLLKENVELLNSAATTVVTMALFLSSEPAYIFADEAQIQQVVMNLITNAAESIEEMPGIVRLTTGLQEYDQACLKGSLLSYKPEPGRFVFLEVSDNGCGMDAETLKRLFDPFFTTKFTGRGLGMSAVNGIMKTHDGALFIESEPGVGSTFRVLLPAIESTSEEKFHVSVTTTDENNSTLKIPLSGVALVVDDEKSVLTTCANMVKFCGYSVITACDGIDAVTKFRESADEINVVLMDLTMPNMDGITAMKEIYSIRPDIKVILSSGYNEEELAEHITGQPPSGFIRKPYSMKVLETEIRRVMQESPS